jgi:hypothetical protein
MNVTIYMIEDRGISKTLHFCQLGTNSIKGYVTVNEIHPWFDKQVDDQLTLSESI